MTGKQIDISTAEEATADDLVEAKKQARIRPKLTKAAQEHKVKYAKPVKHEAIEFDGSIPAKIKVKESQVGHVVPKDVLRESSFRFEPLAFNCHSERLSHRQVKAKVQVDSLEAFLDDATTPMIYGVGGTPDDAKARYFAAFLVAHHLRQMQLRANVVWEVMYGGYDNPLLQKYSASALLTKKDPTLLVLTNLSADSSLVKLEKAKDLVERFPNIPRIIVNAGEDPMSFVNSRLHLPIHALAYFSAAHYQFKISSISVDE
jgi:hypothetical protein